jgi:hypothetical protein
VDNQRCTMTVYSCLSGLTAVWPACYQLAGIVSSGLLSLHLPLIIIEEL